MNTTKMYILLKEVRADYVTMVEELNRHKRLVKPVNPLTLPLVNQMDFALNELMAEIHSEADLQSRQ